MNNKTGNCLFSLHSFERSNPRSFASKQILSIKAFRNLSNLDLVHTFNYTSNSEILYITKREKMETYMQRSLIEFYMHNRALVRYCFAYAQD